MQGRWCGRGDRRFSVSDKAFAKSLGQLGCGHSLAPGFFSLLLGSINNKGQTEAKTMSK